MKKTLKSVTALALALTMLSGCGTGNKKEAETIDAGMATEALFNDMQNGETVEAADALQVFDEALTKINEADSASISVELSISSTEDGEELKTRNVSKLTYMPNPNAATEDTTEVATEEDSEAATGDDTSEDATVEPIAILSVLSEQNDQTNEIEGYYEDGTLYYEMEEKKMKETADFENLKYSFCNYQIGFEDTVVDSAVKVTSKNETKYIIKFDNDAMSEMMMNNITSAGGSTDETMNVDEAYMYFVIDENGTITGYDMELNGRLVTNVASDDEDATDETETTDESETAGEDVSENDTEVATGDDSESAQKESPFNYSMAVNFSDIGSATVTPYEDLDSYRDAYEVLAEEQEAAEQADTEAEVADTDGAEADAETDVDTAAESEEVTQ